jgi:hypothetical protein
MAGLPVVERPCRATSRGGRDQPGSFGLVASDPTAWRVLADLDTDALVRLCAARSAAQELAWAQRFVDDA